MDGQVFLERGDVERDKTRTGVLRNAVPQPGPMVGEHWHDSYEILYIAAGRCLQRVQGWKVELAPGDLFVIAPMQVHATDAIDETGCDIDVIKVGAHLPGEQLSLRSGKYRVGGEVQLGALMCALRAEAGHRDGAHEIMERGLILQLIAAILRCSGVTAGAQEKGYAFALRVEQYVRERMGQRLYLKEAAAHFGYSQEHLTRLLRQLTGLGFKQYVEEIKFTHALYLLRGSGMRVSDVAETLGYVDDTAFVRAFSRRYGFPPAKFVRMFSQNNH